MAQSPNPSNFSYDFLVQVIGGVVAALIVAVLLRRSRTTSWDERRAALNEQIRVRFRQVIDAQTPLSEDEEVPYDHRKVSEADYARLCDQSSKALAEIKAILNEYRFTLAPRVTEMIEEFLDTLAKRRRGRHYCGTHRHGKYCQGCVT